MSKGIYNSELVKRGEVAIKVLSEVKKSKFEGKPDFMFIELDGQERSLSAENPDYFDELILHKDDVVTVKASGRGDTAKLQVLSGGGNGSAGQAGKPVEGVIRGNPGTGATALPDSVPAAQAPTVRSTSSSASLGRSASNGSDSTSNKDTLAHCIDDAIALLDSRLTALTEAATPDARLDAVLRVAMSLFIQSHK